MISTLNSIKHYIPSPKLTVVGAGPGDSELITLKAIRAISSADVILYDALVNSELLEYASSTSEKIFVGKRRGCYSYQQEQINDLIVAKANRYGHVVRLKGGDPFVFGRGSEELEFAQKHHLETEVVPGISSALAVPAGQGIPLTMRHVSESFWVITGTTKLHELSSDIKIAAQSTATIIILMGMGKLSEIVKVFSNAGKENTPVAIIQNGSTRHEKSGFGTIQTIEAVVAEKQLSSPAIIVIGEVVSNRVTLNSISKEVQIDSLIHN
ncbi:MAG: Uroporphyrinogen-III C-methyltransferase [Formosa sp. Hel1_33_131]|jgi:uroporphyrin-III C-methyltransferase|nr:MAG: Uroporphyrinogen-III C-methyltransferase [Formosa sp. Hel1_33_131]|tara:strand:+ start:4162 stop:4965 length:804 start_codon:yes stop_codon:yes gene_type:complete